jgi:hypothetical protein
MGGRIFQEHCINDAGAEFVYFSVSSAMYFMASVLFRSMATNPALVIFAW